MRTLDFAVLGLVAREPSTGYQLAARMKWPVAYYWAEGHSGIYPSAIPDESKHKDKKSTINRPAEASVARTSEGEAWLKR